MGDIIPCMYAIIGAKLTQRSNLNVSKMHVQMDKTKGALIPSIFYFCWGKVDRGAPKQGFKDHLQRQLNAAGIQENDLEFIAGDRTG